MQFKFKNRKLLSLMIVAIFVLNIFIPYPAGNAWGSLSDPKDLGSLSPGDTVTVDGRSKHFHGYWSIDLLNHDYSRIGSAEDLAVCDDFNPNRNEYGDIWNYVAMSEIDDWTDALGGNHSYIRDYCRDKEVTLRANGRSSDRVHLRELAKANGAYTKSYDPYSKEAEIMTTPPPDANISFDGHAVVGEEEEFRLTGSGFAAGDRGIDEWVFEIDGAEIDSGDSTSRLSTSVRHTFNEPGTHTLTLTVWDNVRREGSHTITVSVQPQGGGPPPPNDPPTSGPRADFDMPYSGTVGEDVGIINTSQASDGHTIERVDWQVSPGNYSGRLRDSGGTVTFDQEGSYDVTLTVWDDMDRSDSITKTIFIEEAPPPPPPPNEEPTAKFDMPSHCKQGDTVDVINLSTDDGEIVDVDWDIDPSTGVEPNLGDNGGTITFTETGEYTVTLTVEDDDGATDSDTETIEVENKPPKAKISIPDEIIQGEDIEIKSNSYDPDGEIVSYEWSVTPEGMVGTLEGEQGGTVYFDVFQDYTITLTVEDEWGLTDTATETITVKPAIPEAYFEWTGSPKQNRKVVFDATGSRGSTRYPIDWSLAQWEFIPPDGVPQDAVKVVSSPDLSVREVMFKEPGDYTVRLAVTNTAGNTSKWFEQIVPVSPDKPPVVDFYVPSAVLRDGENDSKAAIELADNSYSPDGDIISKRVWKYRYDSDNDGSFTDESWVVLDDGNNPNPTLYTKDVGKYQFELYVEESFGQETIPQFLTADDLRWGDTSSKPLANKTVEVLNQRPVVSFDAFTKKKADIVFTINSSPPKPEINWTVGATMSRGEFKEVIEAESTEAVKWGSWSVSTGGNLLWHTGSGGVEATFSKPSNAVYIYFVGGDQNDGIAKVYVDGIYYGQYNTYNTGRIKCEIRNLSYTTHKVKVLHGDSKHLSIDYFAIKDVQTMDEQLLSDLNGGINEYFKPKLSANNIDYEITSIETSTFSTNDANAEFIFSDWINYPNDSGKWHLTIKDGENALGTTQNVSWTGFWQPDTARDITIEYDAGVFSGDDDTVGFTFRMQHNEENDTYTGYAFAIDDRTANGGCLHPGLYKLVNVPYEGGNWNPATNGTKTFSNGGYSEKLTATFDENIRYKRYDWQHVKIQAIDNNIKVWVDGTLQIDYTDPDPISWGGYGPFAVSQAYAYFKDVTIITESQKTLDEVLEQPDWREDAQHFLVNISNTEYPGFEDPQKASVIYSRLLNDEIHYCVMGTNANKSQTESVIKTNDNRGTFVYNTNMDTGLSQIADYIIDQVNALQGKKSQYILLNEDIEYKTYYSDNELDPEFQRRWKYSHDPYHFDNSMGLVSYDDQFIDAPVTSFDKVGKFDVVFQARDNPKDDDRFDEYRLWSYMPLDKLTLYVHRKPLAVFNMSLNDRGTYYDINLTSHSYDLDHQTEPGKGITQEVWKWKDVQEAYWHSGKPNTLQKGKVYLIYLKVKDVEGVWSEPNTKVVNTGSANMPPVAQFTVEPNPLPLGKTLTYNNFSYDPDGDNLVNYQWRSQKDGGSWVNHGSTPPSSFGALGDYRIELKVQDENGAWSEPFYQLVTVIPGNTPPVAQFTVNPNPLPLDVTLNYTDTSYDPDGDPIVAREWQYHRVGESWHNGKPTDFSALGVGDYQIRLRVKDQPALAQMTPLWSSWCVRDLQVVAGNEKPVAQFTVTPDPAITDEPVTYNDTSYDPEGAGISERVWRVTKLDGTILGEYHNTLPPSVFATTGWGDGGAGDYRIGLRVKDISPNGISPPLWSDWTWHNLTVVLPLKGSGEITPNPALSGYRVHVTVETEGYAEEVTVKFPNDSFWNGDEITLTPDNPVSNKYNTFRGTYLTDVKTPDGVYNVTATVRRLSIAPETITVPLTAAIQGDIYDQVKVRIKDSR